MQRLVSMKLASNLPKTLTTTTTRSSSLFHFQPHKTFSPSKPPQTHPQNHSFSSTPTHPFHHDHKAHTFLSNPLLRKHISLDSLNTLLRVSSKKLSEFRLGFLRKKSPKQTNFEFIPVSSCRECGRRSWFPRVSSEEMVLLLILANLVVFFLWKVFGGRNIWSHFSTALCRLKGGYYTHTLITCEFGHYLVEELVLNMLAVYLFGNNIGRVFGPEFLLKLYLAGAFGASVFFMVHMAYEYSLTLEGKKLDNKRDPYVYHRWGASGAVTAIMLLDILLHPRATFYFIIPIPSVLLGMFLLRHEFYRKHTTGSSQLGGAAIAVIAWARLRRGHRVF